MDVRQAPGEAEKTRQQREAEFHDECFAEGTRRQIHEIYAATRSSADYYRNLVRSDVAGKDMLEYGCGPDSGAFNLARMGARVTAIDISPVAVEQTRELARSKGAEGVDFRVMDAEALDFPDDSFDVVFGTGILHHLDLARSYAEIARVLRPSGRAIFREPLGHNPAVNFYRWLTPQIRTEDEHPLLMADLRAARDHFGSVEGRYFNCCTLAALPLRKLPGFRALYGLLEGIDQAAFRLLPPTRRYAWQVVLTFSAPKKAAAPARAAGPGVAAGEKASR